MLPEYVHLVGEVGEVSLVVSVSERQDLLLGEV